MLLLFNKTNTIRIRKESMNQTYRVQWRPRHRIMQSLDRLNWENLIVQRIQTLNRAKIVHSMLIVANLFVESIHSNRSLDLIVNQTYKLIGPIELRKLQPMKKSEPNQLEFHSIYYSMYWDLFSSFTFNKVTWSSCASILKPGIRLANSTTPWIAGENRSLKSSIKRLEVIEPVPSVTVLDGNGFNGQVWVKKNKTKQKLIKRKFGIKRLSL